MSNNLTGNNGLNWRGGFVHDFGENWFEMRDRVRDRDEICQACGEDGSTTLLDVHHIVPRREFEVPEHANTMVNLVLLCRPCHTTAEQNMAYCPIPQVRSNGTTYVESADLSIGAGIQQFSSID
ncbi:MAG: HNH endonuclease signature motif containing protein [Halobacteriales archaeon]|nr:HNH endonuclease signature motif containing protein [Halobacteriales archaeon]